MEQTCEGVNCQACQTAYERGPGYNVVQPSMGAINLCSIPIPYDVSYDLGFMDKFSALSVADKARVMQQSPTKATTYAEVTKCGGTPTPGASNADNPQEPSSESSAEQERSVQHGAGDQPLAGPSANHQAGRLVDHANTKHRGAPSLPRCHQRPRADMEQTRRVPPSVPPRQPPKQPLPQQAKHDQQRKGRNGQRNKSYPARSGKQYGARKVYWASSKRTGKQQPGDTNAGRKPQHGPDAREPMGPQCQPDSQPTAQKQADQKRREQQQRVQQEQNRTVINPVMQRMFHEIRAAEEARQRLYAEGLTRAEMEEIGRDRMAQLRFEEMLQQNRMRQLPMMPHQFMPMIRFPFSMLPYRRVPQPGTSQQYNPFYPMYSLDAHTAAGFVPTLLQRAPVPLFAPSSFINAQAPFHHTQQHQ